MRAVDRDRIAALQRKNKRRVVIQRMIQDHIKKGRLQAIQPECAACIILQIRKSGIEINDGVIFSCPALLKM